MNVTIQRLVSGGVIAMLVLALVPCLTTAYTFDKNSLSLNNLQKSADLAEYLSYISQKNEIPRYGNSAAQNGNKRSGGVSLCLWKVCPAAPWLVAKRSRSRRAAFTRLRRQNRSS